MWICCMSPSTESIQKMKDSSAWNVRSQKLFCRNFLPSDTWNCEWKLCFSVLGPGCLIQTKVLSYRNTLDNEAYTIITTILFSLLLLWERSCKMQFIRISVFTGHRLTAVLKTTKVSIRGHIGKSLMEIIPKLPNCAKMCVYIKHIKHFQCHMLLTLKHS